MNVSVASVPNWLMITFCCQGGLWVPQEGVANPSDITQSLARGAVMNGENKLFSPSNLFW